MSATHPDIVLRHLRHITTAEAVRSASDRQLLQRFAEARDEAAFAALVRRHGPLVFSVCRRVLHNAHDAEDVFQATFFVLARKAANLDGQRPLGGWLHQVAYHMAINARKQAAARQKREYQSARCVESDPLAEVSGRDLLAVFDEELQALPSSERLALVLCYLQSKTRDEAAREVGCSTSTLKRRLERGKERLRLRLSRRGVVLSAAALAALFTEQAGAAVPAVLVHAAVQMSLDTATGALTPAAALAEGALKATFATKLKVAAAVLLALGTLFMAGAWARQGRAQPPTPEPDRGVQLADARKPSREEAKEAPKPEGKTMTVSGRVLDPQGKPLLGAQVAVCGQQGLYLGGRGWWAVSRNEVIGRAKTDADGKYRLTVPRLDEQMTYRTVRVVASADGFGLSWKGVKADAETAEVDVRLTPVQRVTGHIVGIQGEDAAGVTIHVVKITRPLEKGAPWQDGTLPSPADLGLTFKTDAKGNFDCGRFGPGVKLECEIREPGYERMEDWFIDTADKKQCQDIRLVLPTGR
jgi:RNA polymerase sigma factor (sigma-70 family)